MSGKVPENALFVCFGCLSSVSTPTRLDGPEAIQPGRPGNADIFYLGGLATEAQTVLNRMRRRNWDVRGVRPLPRQGTPLQLPLAYGLRPARHL